MYFTRFTGSQPCISTVISPWYAIVFVGVCTAVMLLLGRRLNSEAVKPDFHLLGEGAVSLSEVLVAMGDCIYIRVRLEISLLPLKTMLWEVAKQSTRLRQTMLTLRSGCKLNFMVILKYKGGREMTVGEQRRELSE